ncbi:MAG: RNA 2',3'-cyclic phosphodiesterase [Bacteroidota bacterium]
MVDDKTIRLFLGIPLDINTYDHLLNYIANKNLDIRNFKWTDKANLHLTVLFIGNVTYDNLENIKSTISQVLKGFPTFNLYFRNLSYGPPGEKKSMIWVNYEKNENFKHLVFRLSESLLHKAHVNDPLPHVTLARFKGKPDWKADLNLNLPVLPCKSINLWQSELTEAGPKYSVLQSFDLMHPDR